MPTAQMYPKTIATAMGSPTSKVGTVKFTKPVNKLAIKNMSKPYRLTVSHTRGTIVDEADVGMVVVTCTMAKSKILWAAKSTGIHKVEIVIG